MIHLNNISKVIQNESNEIIILNQVSLDIAKGEFVGIIGKSGAGKSTLLHIMAGVDMQSSGLYSLEGVPINNKTIQRKMRREWSSIVMQNFALIHDMDVLDNIMLGNNDITYALSLMEELEIDHLKNTLVKYLSGGEKQRVAIVRALIKKPKVLLCDEPTGALDTQNGFIIMDLLDKLHKEGMTIVLVTHDMNLAEKADRVIILCDGKIIA